MSEIDNIDMPTFNEFGDEEEIIADGLERIKQGVLEQDWGLVCNGYNQITNDHLDIPKVKKESKLEKIRRLIKENNENSLKEKVEKWDKEEFQENATPAKKSRQSKKKQISEPPKVESEYSGPIKTQKLVGGKRFAQQGFEVISNEIDMQEKQKNVAAASKNKIESRSPPPPPLEARESDESGKIGFNFNPKLPPPWA